MLFIDNRQEGIGTAQFVLGCSSAVPLPSYQVSCGPIMFVSRVALIECTNQPEAEIQSWSNGVKGRMERLGGFQPSGIVTATNNVTFDCGKLRSSSSQV